MKKTRTMSNEWEKGRKCCFWIVMAVAVCWVCINTQHRQNFCERQSCERKCIIIVIGIINIFLPTIFSIIRVFWMGKNDCDASGNAGNKYWIRKKHSRKRQRSNEAQTEYRKRYIYLAFRIRHKHTKGVFLLLFGDSNISSWKKERIFF